MHPRTSNIIPDFACELKPQGYFQDDIVRFKDLSNNEEYSIIFDSNGEFERLNTEVFDLVLENRTFLSQHTDFLDNTIKRPKNGGIVHFCNVLEVNITGKGGGINPGIKGISSYLFRQGPMLSSKDGLIISKEAVLKARENLRYLNEKGIDVIKEENVFGIEIDENSTIIRDKGIEELQGIMEERHETYKFLPFIHTEKMAKTAEKIGFDYTADITATSLLTDKFYVLKTLPNFSVKTIFGKELNSVNDLELARMNPVISAQEFVVLKLRDGASGLGVRFVKNNYSEVLKNLVELGEPDERGVLKYTVKIEECLKTLSSPSAGLYISENEIVFLGFSDQFFEQAEDSSKPPKEHMGNIGPSSYENLIKTTSVKVGEFARKLNYTGFLGVDYVLIENHDKSVELRVAENNPRLGGPSTAYRIAYDHPLAISKNQSFTGLGFSGGNLDISIDHQKKSIYHLDKDLNKILTSVSSDIFAVITNMLPIEYGRIQIAVFGKNPENIRKAYRKAQNYFCPNHKSNI